MKNRKRLSISTALNIGMFAFATSALAVSVPQPDDPGLGEMETPVQTALGIMQIIGISLGVAMVMYVGIKYLTSGAGKKAEAKETMVPVLIGAALLALAPTVITWIYNAFAG